ncbi:MAG: NAD-dependent epimerase/dehydratase family protein [Pseudomonadota bacterium]
MKILVTGGAGFIGSHIVDAYIADGHEVVVLDNLSTGSRKNLNPKAKFIELDICSPKAAEAIGREHPDVLNHHAAQIDVRVSVANPVSDIKINVTGLINLMEAGRQAGLKKVIFASSGGTVYGEQREFPATEEHSTWPISPYGLNKLMCEKYLHYYQVQYEIPYVVLRYANIYGPRQNPHGEAGVVSIFIEKMLKGETPVINGDGRQTRDYVYVGDVVEANRLTLLDNARGAYNVGTGVETDVNAIFHALREYSGSNCKEIHGLAKKGEQKRSSISSAKIERELGWHPQVSFFDGMKRTAEWFRNNTTSPL